jgi:hypothetical protein
MAEYRDYDIDAKSAWHKGILYRSVLEARWALFFDSFGVAYEYERKTFYLGNGIYYVPDFYLPELDLWAEVKPTPFTDDERGKCERLAVQTEQPCLMLIGSPAMHTYAAIGAHGGTILHYPHTQIWLVHPQYGTKADLYDRAQAAVIVANHEDFSGQARSLGQAICEVNRRWDKNAKG